MATERQPFIIPCEIRIMILSYLNNSVFLYNRPVELDFFARNLKTGTRIAF